MIASREHSVSKPRSYWLGGQSEFASAATQTSIRTRSLEETEANARAWLDRHGITRIADVTDLDRVGIPTFHSVRPTAASGLNTVTSGKGITSAAARVSAMMEAIERTWCELHGDSPRVTSFATLRNEDALALDPRRLILRQGHAWSETSELGWWPARELVSDQNVLVPALGIFTPYPDDLQMFSSNTIGLAVGNTPREALLHALLELIEHDATAFGEVLRQRQSIELDSLPASPASVVAKFHDAGLLVHMFHYESDIGVPTIYVAIEDPDARDGMLFNGGAGCHLNPEVAAVRALTEAAQSRLSVLAGAREDMELQAYRRATPYEELKRRFDNWTEVHEQVGLATIENTSAGTVDGDLESVLRRLLSAGTTMIFASELAPAELPFSVTKCIVPGLEVAHRDPLRVGPRLSARLSCHENSRSQG